MTEIIESFEIEIAEFPDGTGWLYYYRVDETGRYLVPSKGRELSAEDLRIMRNAAPDESEADHA